MKSLLVAAALCASCAAPALAQEVVLKFATTNAPMHPLNKDFLTPWAERITAEGKGIVRIELSHGTTLADQVNFYSRVLNDVAQISVGLQTVIAGKFPQTEVVTLPALSQKGEESSLALWRLYSTGRIAKEYAEVTPLALGVLPQLSIHSSKPLKSLDDVAGLKVRTGGNVASQVVMALGGTPVSVPLTESYQALAKGTIDAVQVQWTGVFPFKFNEVTSHHIDAQLGSSALMVFMSKKTFDGLPASARALIQKHSGEAFAREFGAFWDRIQASGRGAAVASGKHTITVVARGDMGKYGTALDAVAQKWVKDTPDGAAVLQAYRDELGKIGSGK
jgi:TRAP-type C4-dicarboxylate transport system substrate-binding protein